MRYFVYLLQFPNGKKYIGITKNFRRRMYQHKSQAIKGGKLKLYCAIRKYGWENVDKRVVSIVNTLEEANHLEQFLIKEFELTEKGYNLSPGGHTPLPNQSEIQVQRMKDPQVRKVALEALQTPIAKSNRRKSLNTEEYKQLRSNLNRKRIEAGFIPKTSKSIICNETGERYESIRQAAIKLGGRREHLRDHLKGKKYRPRFKGLTFRYVEGNY